jgi:hypothetical protein
MLRVVCAMGRVGKPTLQLRGLIPIFRNESRIVKVPNVEVHEHRDYLALRILLQRPLFWRVLPVVPAAKTDMNVADELTEKFGFLYFGYLL